MTEDETTIETPSKDRENEEVKEEKAKPVLKPWDGKAKPADKAILILVFVFLAYNIVLRIFTPFLLAEHSLLLSFLSGSSASIGAAGAFAKVDDTSVLIPIILGTLGGVKFLWLFWWAGKRWGNKIIEMVSPSPKIAERFLKLKEKKKLGALLLLVSDLPGVPGMLINLLVGWQKMNIFVFLLLSSIASSFWVIVVALAGYQAGQTGVDIVMTIDKYAIWFSFSIIFILVFVNTRKSIKEEQSDDERTVEEVVSEAEQKEDGAE